MELSRALRFWEPEPEPADPIMTAAFNHRQLPPRKLSLSDLQRMAEAVGQAVGVPSGTAKLVRVPTLPMMGGGQAYPLQPQDATWTDVANAIPVDRLGYSLVATADTMSAPDPSVFPHATPEPDEVTLRLGDGLAGWASLASRGAGHRSLGTLALEWDRLGEPRRAPTARYPLLFLAGLAAAVVPVIVLWARGQLSLLTIPLVVLLVALAFAVASPRIRARVRAGRIAAAGLQIDYRLLDRIRLDRTATRRLLVQNVSSGALGAVVGALITVWLS